MFHQPGKEFSIGAVLPSKQIKRERFRFKHVEYYEIRSQNRVLGFSYSLDTDFNNRVTYLRGAVGNQGIRVVKVTEIEVDC